MRSLQFLANTSFGRDAETRFGIHGGLNFMNANINSSNSDTGFLFGAHLEAPILGEVLFLQPELNFNRVGAQNNSFGGFGTTRFSYLELPVQFKAKIKAGKVEVFGLAGPKISLLLGSSTDIAGFTIQPADRTSYEISLYLGGGVGIGVGDHSTLSLTGRYVLGLNDIDNSASDWKFRGFQLLAGLTF
ncbi:MAG: outer membrane beta-barrel protein [Bdellovibrionota bacterium]